MALMGGGRQKYMTAKGEWRQSCCQADCSLLWTRWPLRHSVVHCIAALYISAHSQRGVGGRIILTSLCNTTYVECDRQCAISEFISVCVAAVPLNKNEISSKTFPYIVIVVFSLLLSVCKNRYRVECLKWLWPSNNCLPSLWHFSCPAAQIHLCAVFIISHYLPLSLYTLE